MPKIKEEKEKKRSLNENMCVVAVLQLLGVDGSALKEALTHKKLTAKGEEVIVLLSMPSCCNLFSVC